MFYHAKNGKIKIADTDMDYISFGYGKKNLVIIPGLGDGMKTVKGMAVPFALMYHIFAKKYKVYIFSRRNKLEKNTSTRDMARDLKWAMDTVGIKKADIVGVSQGGMIAQYFAIDYPKAVRKLVLVVTVGKQNKIIHKSVSNWIGMAKKREYRKIMKDIMIRMYTEEFMEKYRWLLPLSGIMGEPKSYERFLIMAEACLAHDAYDEIEKINVPTLVIGGELDKTVGGEASREIAKKIKDSKLFMYANYGHGLYSEAKDFNRRVLRFLEK